MTLHEEFFKSLDGETSLQLNIKGETELLRKVKRIRDEIDMIGNILHAQKEVFETISAMATREMKKHKLANPESEAHPWEDLVDTRTIYAFCDRIRRLGDDAGRVEDSVLFASFRLCYMAN